jgi:hypothetical protein
MKRTLQKYGRTCRWESNININGGEMSCEDLNLIKLVHDMERFDELENIWT